MISNTCNTSKQPFKPSGKSFDWLLSAIKHNLKTAAEIGYSHSLKSFDNALNTSQIALKEAARNTPQQNDKEQFIEAMEICQNKHTSLNLLFQQHLTSAYSVLANQDDIALKAEMVTEDGDMSSRITMQKLIADAQRHFEKGISASTSGLQNSLDKLEITNHNNPFGPNVIIACSYQALSSENFTPLAIQTLLLHFQQSWFTQLTSFYTQLNDNLRQSGIPLKTTKPTIDNKTAATITDHGFKLDTVKKEVFEGTPAFSVNHHTALIDTTDAIGLIQESVIPPSFNYHDYKTLASAAPINSLTLSTPSVISLISDMQKGYEPNSDGDVIRYIRQQLNLPGRHNQSAIISTSDENTINLISLCFRAIAAPLPQNLMPLILRLKPAYARIALDDGFFFHDNLHPARKLLDQLLSLINSNFNDQAITRYVKTVVMKVQLKFNGDISLFDQLLSDIEGYRESEEQQYQSNQDALIQQFSEKENQQMAVAACNKYLQEQIDALPTQLEYFMYFKIILSPVLAKKYLKHGGKSEHWQTLDKSIQHIFSMLRCTDLNTLRSQAKSLAKVCTQFSQLLSDGGVSIINKQILLEQLQDIQILQMQGKTLSSIYDSQLKFHNQISDYLLEHQQEQTDTFNSSFIGHQHSQLKTAQFARFHTPMSEQETTNTYKQLSIGQWLSILIDQKPIRLQYGFHSRTDDMLVFFNSQHEKAFERSSQDLKLDFATGFACLIEHTANFDAALEQVSKRLSLLRRQPNKVAL